MRSHHRRRWLSPRLLASRIGVLLLIVSCAASLSARRAELAAQSPSPSEFEVKAAYLYNFGKFVEWPEPALAQGDSFAICVLGRDPFGPILDTTLAGQTLKGKPAVARRIARVQDAAGCRILFISASQRAQLAHILAAVSGLPVLTVSDIEGFAARGGMVQFVLEDFRVRFELNVASAASAGLTFSAQLLRVAKSVRGAPSEI
ncbi:MAG: YfiR family protein [Candidatus Acidiferrales bacterium]